MKLYLAMAGIISLITLVAYIGLIAAAFMPAFKQRMIASIARLFEQGAGKRAPKEEARKSLFIVGLTGFIIMVEFTPVAIGIAAYCAILYFALAEYWRTQPIGRL